MGWFYQEGLETNASRDQQGNGLTKRCLPQTTDTRFERLRALMSMSFIDWGEIESVLIVFKNEHK